MTDTLADAQRLKIIRTKILRAAMNAGEGHIPSSLSILDILYSLYIILPRNTDIDFTKSDFFILSKGHAALALYAILEEAGFIGPEWVETFGSFRSSYGGHPDMKKIAGVSASTGSLGHGLPMALGKVFAKRILNKKTRGFCLVGDGELNEGTIWESLLLAAHHEMSELTVIVDNNGSSNHSLSVESLTSKFKSFGFSVVAVDGHSHKELESALMAKVENSPRAIIAQTIKGFGVPAMQNNNAWHHLSPSKTEFDKFISEL
jgi:transketolase